MGVWSAWVWSIWGCGLPGGVVYLGCDLHGGVVCLGVWSTWGSGLPGVWSAWGVVYLGVWSQLRPVSLVKARTRNQTTNSPFSTVVLGWGPLKARNFPGTIQFRSPFSTRYEQKSPSELVPVSSQYWSQYQFSPRSVRTRPRQTSRSRRIRAAEPETSVLSVILTELLA